MILCCGEALIDMLPRRTDTGEPAFTPVCGGAVFNTAIALGRLAVNTGMLTGLSTDMFGQQLKAGLDASDVDTSYIMSRDRPSTLAFVQLTDGQASYSFFDENSAGRMITAQDMPALSPDVTALYFGGISLVCEPAADAYAALAVAQSGTRAVMLDPNIRVGFIEDETRYRARLDRMIDVADIIKVSDEDLQWLLPDATSLPEKAKTVLARGPSMVIVTEGAKGVTAYLKDGSEVHAPAQQVTVVDTVGAGDTFNAGVLKSLWDNNLLQKPQLQTVSAQQIADALSYGARVAAVTVSRAGANPPWISEL